MYLLSTQTRVDLDGIGEDIQSRHRSGTEVCVQVGEKVRCSMATKIRRTEAAKAIVMGLMQVIDPLNEAGTRPEDIAHALVFILVAYKVNTGWSTEQVLQLFEHYVRETDKMMPEELPSSEDYN